MRPKMNRVRWTTVAMIILIFSAVMLQRALFLSNTAQAQDRDAYLPVLRDDSEKGEATPTNTPEEGTPTATPTASPTPTMTPEPTPTLDPAAVGYDGATCAEGFHLIHESGVLGALGPDTIDGDEEGVLEPASVEKMNIWTGYYCVPDQKLTDISCSDHGTPHLLDGVATCACETGYVGAQCNVCAPGYALNTETNACEATPDTTPDLMVRGADDAIERDAVVELSAMSRGVQGASAEQTLANARWEIDHGYGCLLATRDAETCLDVLEGETVYFKAPPGDGLNATGLRVTRLDDGGQAIGMLETTVLAQPPGYIPINGYGDPELQPILDKMLDFMKTRCVGAGVLGVAYYGKPVGVWGLGKTFGRASSTIFDAACGNNADDPHEPSAPNMGNQMGVMIGSVSKTVTFATARWALKEAMAQWDVDLDLTALNSSRLVGAQRRPNGTVRLQAWNVNLGGVVAEEGTISTQSQARDFSLARLTDTRAVGALRTPQNGLQIIVWDVDGSGQFNERTVTDVTGLPGTGDDSIKQVRIARVANDQFVAAMRRSDDTISLMMWDVSGNGTLTELVGVSMDSTRARDLDLIVLDGGTLPHVILAWRAVDNTLDARWYDVSADGNLLLRDDHDTTVQIEDLDMAALSASRFAVAIRLNNGNLRVMSWGLNDSPFAVFPTDSETAGAVEDLAISKIGTSGFAVVVRQANSALKLITWVLDANGNLTRRGDDEAGTNNGAALANLIFGGDTLNSVLYVAVRTASHTVKVIPWNVTGPNPMRLANEGDAPAVADYGWTDSDIEAMQFVGFDLPQGFLPERNRQLFAGEAPLPIDLPAANLSNAQCNALSGLAAEEWQQVQLRHLFGHRTGMAKSFSPSAVSITVDYLDELRGLDAQGDWADEEEALRAEWGDANVEAARAALGWNTNLVVNGDTDGYLIEAPTLLEILEAIASRCLPYGTGSYQYSNASPQLMRTVIEHVTGKPYVFKEGYPEQHTDSLYYEFLNSQLELTTSPTDNIFPHRPGLTGPNDQGPPGPILRLWDSDLSTYYWDAWDRKRPHCDWTGSTCDLGNWSGANGGRINWYWANEQVQAPYFGNTGGTATGGLRAEPESFLKFMSEYWAGGYGGGSPASFDPFIGEARNNTWNISTNHNGSVGGGYAYSIHRSNGVDIFVAVNQNGGKSGEAYDALYTMMIQGINGVDWSEVELLDEIQIAP